MNDWCFAWRAGCDVAWNAWATITQIVVAGAALAGVYAALKVAKDDRRERRDAQRAESLPLAMYLAEELQNFSDSLRGYMHGLKIHSANDLVARFDRDGQLKRAIGARIEKMGFSALLDSLPRLHVLPHHLTATLVSCHVAHRDLVNFARLISSPTTRDSRPVSNASLKIGYDVIVQVVLNFEQAAKDLKAYENTERNRLGLA